jgi:hypothetical protein
VLPESLFAVAYRWAVPTAHHVSDPSTFLRSCVLLYLCPSGFADDNARTMTGVFIQLLAGLALIIFTGVYSMLLRMQPKLL